MSSLRGLCRLFLTAALVLPTVLPSAADAQETALEFKGQQIAGPPCAVPPRWEVRAAPRPCSEEQLAAWRSDAHRWREERRMRAGLDGAAYAEPALRWTQSSFVQPQMMAHDRYFYDPVARRYTVGRYLDDLDRRYGAIDSVLVWPTYPNLGVDDRNQYDLLHDLPGGIAGIRGFVADFHARGVKVLFPVMPWDVGTRDAGTPLAEGMAAEVAAVGADGINGDTMEGVPRSFKLAANRLGRVMALEPEIGPASDEMLGWNVMSWGYWDYEFVPTVSRYKWLEPRHMIHVSNRFAHDHTDDLQFAFFNGTGFESWENVWGIWNGLSPRDADRLRRVASIERFGQRYLTSEGWEPFTPMRQYGVFASRWPVGDDALWTIVNRNAFAVDGRQILVRAKAGERYFDLWRGVELLPGREGEKAVLSFPVEARGFGAVLATSALDADLQRLLAEARNRASGSSAALSGQWQALRQTIVPIAATAPPAAAPPGMSLVPAADFTFRVNGVQIEGFNDEGVDVQYAGEASPRRFHENRIPIASFWIDTTPVTNSAYKRFLEATRYRPADDHNFLRDWKDGMYPQGWADKPVTWVSLEDARAFARWAGKRLPHEWEWQYAAQGTDGRAYPWGDTMIPANMPVPDSGRRMLPASDVHAHPGGASPFGVLDLVGNVWQWTDEWHDDHNRAAIVRGGSHYVPAGARWYFPQALELSQHGKYLLMAPGIDRSGSIGFRCVMDAAATVQPPVAATPTPTRLHRRRSGSGRDRSMPS